MRAWIGVRTVAALVAATLVVLTVISCTRESRGPTDLSTPSSGSVLGGADDARPESPARQGQPGSTSRLPPESILDDPCADLIARAQITTRDPTSFWTVTGLEGEISNPSSSDVHVTAVLLQFEPGTPAGVHTAELTVPLDLTLSAGSSAPWTWTGSILVRPFHDDAPQPVVEDLEWTRSPGTVPSCDDKSG